jgi:rhodanese-related sulfurtransferase
MASSKPTITLSSLKQIHPTTLAPLILDPEAHPKVAVIDVRDSDHIGGNINGSTWIPIHQLDARMPELLRTLKDKEKVVFHCMLSQQRGPKAALMYARAKQRADEKALADAAKAAAQEENSQKPNDDDDASKKSDQEKTPTQQVCVLEGGFGWWQSRYGEDPRLTADYEADIWL